VNITVKNMASANILSLAKLSGVYDLRLAFRDRAELERFLRAHDVLSAAPEAYAHCSAA
jgi:hypothetical protein